MSSITLIPKQLAAKTVTRTITKGIFPKTLVIDGDLAANVIPISFIGINGTDTTLAYNDAGVALEFNATKTSISITSPCKLSIVKGITANTVGLELVEID